MQPPEGSDPHDESGKKHFDRRHSIRKPLSILRKTKIKLRNSRSEPRKIVFHRAKRPRPHLDDKSSVEWPDGLSYARAHKCRDAKYLQIATRAAIFLRETYTIRPAKFVSNYRRSQHIEAWMHTHCIQAFSIFTKPHSTSSAEVCDAFTGYAGPPFFDEKNGVLSAERNMRMFSPEKRQRRAAGGELGRSLTFGDCRRSV